MGITRRKHLFFKTNYWWDPPQRVAEDVFSMVLQVSQWGPPSKNLRQGESVEQMSFDLVRKCWLDELQIVCRQNWREVGSGALGDHVHTYIGPGLISLNISIRYLDMSWFFSQDVSISPLFCWIPKWIPSSLGVIFLSIECGVIVPDDVISISPRYPKKDRKENSY